MAGTGSVEATELSGAPTSALVTLVRRCFLESEAGACGAKGRPCPVAGSGRAAGSLHGRQTGRGQREKLPDPDPRRAWGRPPCPQRTGHPCLGGGFGPSATPSIRSFATCPGCAAPTAVSLRALPAFPSLPGAFAGAPLALGPRWVCPLSPQSPARVIVPARVGGGSRRLGQLPAPFQPLAKALGRRPPQRLLEDAAYLAGRSACRRRARGTGPASFRSSGGEWGPGRLCLPHLAR